MGTKNSMTRFLEDIIDDTKDFVDDLIDRARSVEGHARDAVRDAADDDDTDPEMEKLRKSLGDLKKKVDQMATSGSRA